MRIKSILLPMSALLVGFAAVPASSQDAAAPAGQGAGYPKGQYTALDQLPDWGGIWFMTFEMPAPGSGPAPQPKLKGEYLERYQAWREVVLANDGVTPRDRSNCSPPGMPMMMQLPQYPYEFLFTPGRVTINQEAWMQTRTIWTDGRALPEDPDPAFNGYSTGRWEGDTLVAETIGMNDAIEFGMGMFHSNAFRVTERIRLDPNDPDKLVSTMTLTDPEALEEPFTQTVSYKRDRAGTLLEFQCAENDRNPVGEDGQTQFH